ncbi:MAG: hypothetical protein P4L62_03105 [Candidatus Pacebacteria bacterium]|nr:hypothetical protein [Candidatus Paceibacterota bacterium]MDR3583321.1 hypothetical protein [Candidatus Paceibacterota bacterium]
MRTRKMLFGFLAMVAVLALVFTTSAYAGDTWSGGGTAKGSISTWNDSAQNVSSYNGHDSGTRFTGMTGSQSMDSGQDWKSSQGTKFSGETNNQQSYDAAKPFAGGGGAQMSAYQCASTSVKGSGSGSGGNYGGGSHGGCGGGCGGHGGHH